MNRLLINTASGTRYANLKGSSELSQKLLGEDIVKVFFDIAEPFEITIGDSIDVFGKRYFINTLPIIRKLSSRLYEFECTFEAYVYDLSKVSYMDVDAKGVHVSHEFYLTGLLEDFVMMIARNMERVYGTAVWAYTIEAVRTDYKTISFSDHNCLSALAEICKEFSVEYEVVRTTDKNALVIKDKIGGTQKPLFKYGYGNGLYSLKRNLSTASNICTRLFAFGSSKNLGPNYRNFSPRLKMPAQTSGQPNIFVSFGHFVIVGQEAHIFGQTNAAYVQLQIPDQNSGWVDYGTPQNGAMLNYHYLTYYMPPSIYSFRIKAWNIIGKYVYSDGTYEGWGVSVNENSYIDNDAAIALFGVIEKVVIFDDIYPHRIGTVTGIGDTYLKFIDSGMFDLNAVDGSGNTLYLLPGLEAKIHFNTGNLAGYEFTINNYNTASKMFSLNSIVDERSLEIPNPDESAFKINVGDKYVIIDIKLPAFYITEAENELYNTAFDWLVKYSNYHVLYDLEIDEKYMKANSFTLGVGDEILVEDEELGLMDMMRILEVRRNLVHEFKYEVKLSETQFKQKRRPGRTTKKVKDTIAAIATPASTDFVLFERAGTTQPVKVAFTDIKSTLKEYFNTVYTEVIHNDHEPVATEELPSPQNANFFMGDDYEYHLIAGRWKRSSLSTF